MLHACYIRHPKSRYMLHATCYMRAGVNNSECPLWVMNHLRDPVMGYELHIWRGGVIIFKLRREILTSPPQIQESRVILPTPSFYSSSRYAL